MLPPAARRLLPLATMGSFDPRLGSEKSCSPDTITPPASLNAPARKHGPLLWPPHAWNTSVASDSTGAAGPLKVIAPEATFVPSATEAALMVTEAGLGRLAG